jgi:glycosyltransferase involved in cell wall biosynthesis
MRIAMLGWEFPPFVSGGLGVHCFELTRSLCSRGCEVDFFMPVSGATPVQPSCSGLRIIEVAKTELMPYLFFSKKSQGSANYGENLLKAVEEYSKRCSEAVARENVLRHYEILHSHDWLTARAGESSKGVTHLPLVQTFHSTEYDRTSWPWDYILDVERDAAKNADLIIAVSRRTKAQVLRLGADGGKIRVVYNGVDRKKFASHAYSGSAAEVLKSKYKIVLFLGRLTEQKGPVQFLHAAKKVLDVRKDVIFVIAGKGELMPLLINMALEMGISKNVKFLGYVDGEDQRKLYRLADVYVMPSTSEPFGITALEAMSSSVPVIISKTSGVSEVVKSAIRVDFWDINAMAEKILAVLKYPPLANALTRLSSAEVCAHTWEKTADETIGVYLEAISQKK